MSWLFCTYLLEKKKILIQLLHLKLLLSLINNYFMYHSNIIENCSKSFTLVWLSKTDFIHLTTDFFKLIFLVLWFSCFCSSPAVPFSGCRRCWWGLSEPAEDSGTRSCPGVHHPSSQPFTGNLKQKQLQYNVFFLFRLMSQKWRTARV